jgi:hypothetical protein
MALTIDNLSGSVQAAYSNVKETFPQSTDTSLIVNQGIATTNNLVAGTGYVTATDLAVTGGTGTGAIVDITAVAGGVTVVTVTNPGSGYTIADTLTIVAGNSDATFDVLTLEADTVSVTERDVYGVGSAFTTDFQKGDFVWFTDTDELRRIENIVDDTKMTLEHPVAATITAKPFKVISREGYNSVSWLNDSVGAIEINGIAMPADASDTFRTDLKFFPILIDSTSNANVVYLTAKNW